MLRTQVMEPCRNRPARGCGGRGMCALACSGCSPGPLALPWLHPGAIIWMMFDLIETKFLWVT